MPGWAKIANSTSNFLGVQFGHNDILRYSNTLQQMESI